MSRLLLCSIQLSINKLSSSARHASQSVSLPCRSQYLDNHPIFYTVWLFRLHWTSDEGNPLWSNYHWDNTVTSRCEVWGVRGKVWEMNFNKKEQETGEWGGCLSCCVHLESLSWRASLSRLTEKQQRIVTRIAGLYRLYTHSLRIRTLGSRDGEWLHRCCSINIFYS